MLWRIHRRLGMSGERSRAYRVYQDPADLLHHLDEVGMRMVQ